MSQYNDIKITPNSGVSSDPKIEFIGAGNSTITLKVTDGTAGEVVFENEDQKELLSLFDGSSTDPIFSVNDSISLPALQVYEDGRLLLAPYAGYNIGIGTTNPTSKLSINGNISSTGIEILGLNSSISDTAVDVFVYDTRKDSDGGAWRKRTQHTSWYNETLNTATRGSRREFPSVAVIVIDSTFDLTIYDGDDPDLPMWMKFENSGFLSWSTINDCEIKTVSMLNGIFVTGCDDGDGGIHVNFVNDHVRTIFGNGNKYDITGAAPIISNRSATVGFLNNSAGDGIDIVNSQVNDVAMTVLPNAPIDPSTGLPIPTIAVATDDGVSVIKDDGNVWDIYPSSTGSSSTFGAADGIYIDSEYVYFGFERLGALNHYIMRIPIPNSDLYPGAGAPYYYAQNWWQGVSENTPINNSNGTVSGKLLSRGDIFYIGGTKDDGTVLTPSLSIHERNPVNKNAGLTCAITKSYNSGWMHGYIRGAFLSDTDDTDVTGTELWPEGDFADANEWPSAGAELTISGGTATVSDGDGGYSFLGSSTGTLTNGKKYVLSFTVSNYSGGRLEASQANSSNIQIPFSANGSYSQLINYTGTTGSGLGMYGYGGGAVGFTLDNLYLRELEEQDRSVNNTGLAVYGKITKTPVATGADLVAYSGFSDGDYLKQPHNSSLEFGTGSFSCTVWFKSSTADGSNFKGLVYLNQNGIIGEGFQILLDPSNGIYFYIYGPTNDFNSTFYTGYNDGNWHQISVSSTGTHQRVYLDGVLKETGNITTGSITNTSSELFIGKWYGNTSSLYYWRGSIALCRISGSIPSPEQIKKIYEDEKVLFQENAACTLYGSSDAVTALAYDDDNQLLHVGTSSGRSDFQGLRRINNTTTAVTTAISASNGLIAEQ